MRQTDGQTTLYVPLGQIDSATVEKASSIGKGAKLIVQRRNTIEAHQVNANSEMKFLVLCTVHMQ
jgi:hypothetical protein